MKKLIFLILLSFSSTFDYCSEKAQKELCQENKHIACCKDDEQTSCITNAKEVDHDKGKAVYPTSKKFNDMIVDKHNEIRNLVACGEHNYSASSGEKLPVPDLMYELTWNIELATSAQFLVKNCNYGHSKCHNSHHFPCSGQNLGMGGAMEDNRDFAMKIIDLWFSEYAFLPNITDLLIFSGTANPENESVGHFTALIRDDQTHIGCAMAKCRSKSATTIIFACNYSQTNMIGQPTYTFSNDSEPGGQCEKKSEKHKCLCAR